MKDEFTESSQASFLLGGGEMGALMRQMDWSQTLLGTVETCPQSLRSALSICLNSRFPIAIYWGPDYVLLYNDAWRPIVGNKHPWSLGRPAREVWTEIWNEIGPELASVLASGEGIFHKDELLSMHRFGYTEECFFEYTFNPIRGEGGITDGVFNIVTETTYRVLSDRRAHLLREVASKTGTAKTIEQACGLMVATLKSAPIDIPFLLLYLIDPDGGQARLCSGTSFASNSSVSPQAVNLMIADDSNGWPIALAARTAQPQEVNNLVSRFGELPGSPWIEPPQEAMVLPIVAPGLSKVTGVLIAVASPRLKLDASYRDFFSQISGQIAIAIMNAQTYEEERRRAEALAEIDRAKTVFFSNVSHEFRTPLTLMLNPLEQALANPAGPLPSDREPLETAYRNTQRLLKLVNTLLDFSRIEAGRVQASYQPTDLAAFTAELASVFRSAIEQANLRLIVNCPPLPASVYVDREMWEKIVLNLLSNAFKFTFTGEISVGLTWANQQIKLTVQDTGIGIPDSELPRLFERFHRIEGAQGRSVEGSGIGLSLVQELVNLHQGAISVTSVEGAGTCFTISIPTGTAHLPSDRISASRTSASTASNANAYLEEALRWLPDTSQPTPVFRDEELCSSSLRSENFSSAKIILADDNTDMRDYIKRLLGQQYQVEAVSDGLAVLAAVHQQVPDLILTDVMMPNLDGFGLLQVLRAEPQTREIPIILLSARAGEEARIEGLAAGADDYLVKPFSARELLARVEATLKLAQLRREAGAALRKSEEKYRTLFESINQGFCVIEMIFDPTDRPIDYRFLITNPAFDQQTGTENALGKAVREIAPRHEDYWFETYGNVALTGEPIRFENWAQEFQRWYEVHAFRVGEPALRQVGILFNDVSDRVRAENERKQVEASLQQSNDRFSAAMRAVEGIVFEWNLQTQTVYRSEGLFELMGVRAEEAPPTAEWWQEQVHPEDVARLMPTIEEFLNSSSDRYQGEYRVRHAAGYWVQVWERGYLQRNAEGDIIGVVGFTTDISQRKQAETALRQSESRFRLMVESAKEYAIFTLDMRGTVTGWNSGAERLLGYPEADIIGCDGHILYGPEAQEQQRAEQEMQTALDQGQAVNECWHVRQDGSRFWGSGLVMPLQDEVGNVQGFVKIMQDKTKQRRADQRFRLLYETTSDLLAIEQPLTLMHNLFSKLSVQLDLDSYYNYMVEEQDHRPVLHLRNYQGISEEAAASLEWIEFDQYLCGLVAQEQRQIVLDQAQIATHPNAQGVCLMGVTAYAGQPLIAQGRLLGTLSFASRTRTRFTDGEIALLQSTCDQMAIALDRANLIASIQQQAEQLQQANQIKDEFLAVLSHELRSPLNPILGWIRLLQKGKLDQTRQAEALTTIERNAKLQAQLVEDLLDISRIMRGKLTLKEGLVNLNFVISGAIETVHLAAEAKNIQIMLDLDPTPLLVSGDATRLQQVVWNLLSNAVKFTPNGRKVSVELSQIEHLAQIRVIDTGKGISPQFLPHVFEYFRQQDGSTTRQFGGLGLGLAIARQIVELHGGTVRVESFGEDQGATFTVQLPLLQQAISPPSEPTSASLSTEVPLSNLHILLVEDETDTRDFQAFVLEQSGARVTAVASGLQALQVLDQSSPDLLVSDVGMAEMNGYTLIEQIRARPANQSGQIKAIALTAYAAESDHQKALQAGFQAYLTKPVEPEELIKTITNLLEESK
ncbi:MAG: response regulator [Aphanocapsa sp. GSE-SYN-MK-11-07L]|jgi:PAS domain S-box-containing protein|nr:response regulator [Aphanocapsa sp. GSE-SYN-MK-11-07L]